MTAPAILALVRHGESTWIAEERFQGQGDPPLSEVGRRQAAALGSRLASTSAFPALPVPNAPPQVIWHSPLLRASQTAAAIHEAREADAPLRHLDALKELSQGEWEGLRHDQVRERYPEQLAAWQQDPFRHHAPGGESLADAHERALVANATILERDGASASHAEGGGRGGSAGPVLGYAASLERDRLPWAVVVAHDGILRLMMLELLAVPIERFWAFPFALAAVTVLDLSGAQVRLRAHNLDGQVAPLTP